MQSPAEHAQRPWRQLRLRLFDRVSDPIDEAFDVSFSISIKNVLVLKPTLTEMLPFCMGLSI